MLDSRELPFPFVENALSYIKIGEKNVIEPRLRMLLKGERGLMGMLARHYPRMRHWCKSPHAKPQHSLL